MTYPRLLFGCVLLLCLGFTGCVEVTFPEPMPAKKKELTQFPQAWQGTWVSDAPNEEEETLVVRADRILGNPGSDDLVLGKNCVLKKLGRRLVLNIPQEKGGRYTLLVAERHGDALNIHTLDPKKQQALDSWEEVLGHENVVKLHKNDDPTDKLREVQLNPRNTRQFRRLLRKGKTTSVTYTKVVD
ncbi:MAG: hypothetical protein ACPF8U_06910 [Flavobacteriales bacterium]